MENDQIDNTTTQNQNTTTQNQNTSSLKQILDLISKEDHSKIFTGEIHPNIFDAVSPIVNQDEPKEIERTLKHYFEQVIQITQENTETHLEAQRMLQILERIFEEGFSANEIETQSMRDLTDEIVDFYIDSLKHFSSYVNEEVLNDHISYLDKH